MKGLGWLLIDALTNAFLLKGLNAEGCQTQTASGDPCGGTPDETIARLIPLQPLAMITSLPSDPPTGFPSMDEGSSLHPR